MWNKNLKLNSGFTLLEVIIAIFVISVGVGGVAAVVPRLLSASTVNQNRLIAAYLAQEGIEIVRNVRDTNWLENQYGGTPVPWDEGLTNCPAPTGCELDFYCTNVQKPIPTDPAGHNCFKTYNAGDFLYLDPAGSYNYLQLGTQTKFSRKVTIDEGSNILTITATVYWTDKGKSYNFPAQEKLYTWY
jgi:prepilin-type N-terminal cleavage/methylation domain-containing protein